MKQNFTRLALPQNLGFRFWLHAAAIKERKRLTVKQKTFLQHLLRPRSHFVGVYLFAFRFVGYTHRRRESDDLRFEFLLGSNGNPVRVATFTRTRARGKVAAVCYLTGQRLGKNLDFLQLDAEKTGEEVNRHPQNYPSP